MNKIKYLLILALSLFVLSACTDDDGKNPAFGDDELYLHGEWNTNIVSKIGNKLTVTPPQESPANAVYTYKWTIDGELISDKKELDFDIKQEYWESTLRYEITNAAGTSSYREANLLIPKAYVPKKYNKLMVGYYAGTDIVRSVDWKNITHLIVTSVIVNAELDADKQETGNWYLDDSSLKDIDFPSLIAYAHNYGVTLSLQFSPRFVKSRHKIVQFDGRHIWGSLTFYNAAVNHKGDLIKAMIAKENEYGLDGVDIHMNKSEATNFPDPAALKTFYEDFAAAVPEKIMIDGTERDYLLTQTAHGGWTRAAMTDIYKIERYKWINMTYFGYVDLSPADPAIVNDTNGAVNAMTAAWGAGVSPDRVVLVVPGYGVRFFGVPPFTWDNLDTHTEFLGYKDVLSKYPKADDSGILHIKENGGDPKKEIDVVYYEGLTKLSEKLDYAITQKNIAGMGVWSIEGDSRDARSMVKKINSVMGNDFTEVE